MRAARSACFVALAALGGLGAAQTAAIRVTAFPQVSVADARSTVTISAEVRDGSGRLALDGTQVLFSTTLGSFREPITTTYNGVARAVLVAGGLPGTARITATAPGLNAESITDFEFLSDRGLLASANEYVEVVAPTYLAMSLDQKILGATGPKHGAHLRYREVQLEADDLQFDIQAMEVRARRAHLKMGKVDQAFDDLYLKLNLRKGVGTGAYQAPVITGVIPQGRWFSVVTESRARYGLVEIRPGGLSPSRKPATPSDFEFVDYSRSATMISAKKAVVFPRREVQFHKAEVVADGAKVMRFALFQVSLTGPTPILTEQIISVNDSHLAVNYPHYLSLKPGLTSLMRFRTGENIGRGMGASGGSFLDYEVAWNRGDRSEGGFTFSGLNRSDSNLSLRHYLRMDDRTTLSAQLESPAERSIFGSLNVNRQFAGYQVGLSGISTRSLRGVPYANQQLNLTAETDPIKAGRLPVQLYYGLTASSNSLQSQFLDRSQSAIGARLRSQLLPRQLDRVTRLNASCTVSELAGHNSPRGLSMQGTTSVNRRLGGGAGIAAIYDYLNDPISSPLTG
ncbi:MAG: hypothetical protein HY248_06040, partial [Fimbriimonas ginsengisoli]|nr:hypothetical protein [Fimbriimonas ginsengisoli]